MTLGSLFDGSGGFPLAGLLAGITPLWASEIEPFPIRVTTKRLPFVKHLGDISLVDGAEAAPVDIVTFGSPCTDMSVAGKRAGLDGKRPTKGKISGQSSKRSAPSKAGRFLFLCLQGGDGQTRGISWETGFPLRGASSMPNFGESPSVGNASTLSQILQAGVPERYYLSPRACQGILRRASVRGKELPAILKRALERQAASGE